MDEAPAWQRLERRVIAYWLVNSIIGLTLLGGALWLGWRLSHDKLKEYETLVRTIALGGFAALATWSLLAPLLAYWRWRFSIQPALIVVRHGILFHEEKVIPTNRLQHVDLLRGPIETLFGLATLIVFTAGTESASFRVPGLAVPRARALRDRILEARGDDVL